MNKRYYIAYGSNLNVPQMRWRCPEARIVGTAELQGWRLMYKGSKTGSYLTIEPEEACTVPVAVWDVSPADEARLDRYEGYPRFYYKRELTIDIRGIRTGKVRRRQAFVYIMHEDHPLGLPYQEYVDVCMEGYRAFGFDEAVLEAAYEYSKEAAI